MKCIVVTLIILLIPALAIGQSLVPPEIDYTVYTNPVANLLLCGYSELIHNMEVFASDELGFMGYEDAEEDAFILQSYIIRGIPEKAGLFGSVLSGNPGSPTDIQRDVNLLLNVGKSISAVLDANGFGPGIVREGQITSGIIFWDMSEDAYKFDFFFMEFDDGHTYLAVRMFDQEGIETLYLLNDRNGLVTRLKDIVEQGSQEVTFAPTPEETLNPSVESTPVPTDAPVTEPTPEITPMPTIEPVAAIVLKEETEPAAEATQLPEPTLIPLSYIEASLSSIGTTESPEPMAYISDTRTPAPTPVSNLTPTLSTDEIHYVRIDRKNAAGVRAEPDKASSKIAVAAANKKYRMLSITDNGWYQIVLEDGRIGYVSPNMAEMVR